MDDLVEELIEGFSEHLRRLDEVSTEKSLYFKGKREKNKYETLFTYSFRKYLAAKYHLSNVRILFSLDEEDARKTLSLIESYEDPLHALTVGVHRISVKYTNNSNEYSYELSAFLEAIKSSVDMLAEAVSITLPGVTANYSITPLLKIASKDDMHPVLHTINIHRPWLENLRNYRHYLVHRLVPIIRSGCEGESVAGSRRSSLYPVVIPEITPSYVIDTREARTMDDDEEEEGLNGLIISRMTSTIDLGDGRPKIIQNEIDIKPAPGYILLSEFMNEHLSKNMAFITAMTGAIDKVAFEPAHVQ